MFYIYTKNKKFPSPYGVSFILILKDFTSKDLKNVLCFRLLTEYHSFLCLINVEMKYYLYITSFRLLTEYHSFLLLYIISKIKNRSEFPSPYGVSFILINLHIKAKKEYGKHSSFRLLTEYHSFL